MTFKVLLILNSQSLAFLSSPLLVWTRGLYLIIHENTHTMKAALCHDFPGSLSYDAT